MPTSLISFSATPLSIEQDESLTLQTTSLEDGTVIYSLPDDAPVTFSNGQQQIKGLLVNNENTTTTSLHGTQGLVLIEAWLEGEQDSLKQTIHLTN